MNDIHKQPFQPLDRVYVVLARNNIFSWQTSTRIEAHVTKKPYDVGDTYQFITTAASQEFSINPNTPDFIGLELIERIRENKDLPF